MVQPLNWRLNVNLSDGKYAQVATIDFARRETLDLQLVQLFFKQHGNDLSKLFEFTNELGELLAFRASAYDSHTVTEIESA
jgi:hypothetical protein